MGKKTNWGAGLRALGSGLQGLAMMQREERMREEEIAREAELYNERFAARNKEWLARETQKRMWAEQDAAAGPQDPLMPLPVGAVNLPFGGGNANLLGEALKSTPEMQDLIMNQAMSGPPRRSEFRAQMDLARKRIAGDVARQTKRGESIEDTQTKSDITLLRGKDLADYKEGLKTPPPVMETKKFTYPKWAGGETVEMPLEEWFRSKRDFYGEEEDSVLSQNALKPAAAAKKVEGPFPAADEIRRWDDRADGGEGAYVIHSSPSELGALTPDEQRLIGPELYAKIRRDMLAAYESGRFGLTGTSGSYDAAIDAVGLANITPESIPLDNALDELFDGTDVRWDDAGTPAPEDDRVIVPTPGPGFDKVYDVQQIRDKLKEASAKKGSVHYMAMKKILGKLPGSEYNAVVPDVGPTPNPDDQVGPFIPQEDYR